MAKTKISEYSTTNSSNTDINSINIDEGCAPSGINNAIREVMVHLKNWQTNASGDGATFANLVVQGTGSFTGAVTMSAGATLSGTNTLSGSNIISGNINSSGTTNTFSGTQVISGNINSSGTTNTFSGSVVLSGGTANGVLYLNGSKVATTGSAFVFDGTNVGIGTSSPVVGGAYSAAKSVTIFGGTNSGVESTAYLEIGSSTNVNDYQTGAIAFYNNDNSGANANTRKQTAIIRALSVTADSNAGNDSGGNLTFLTKANEGSLAERMRIDSSGNVGIGTSSPAVKLDVNGSINSGNNSTIKSATGFLLVQGQTNLILDGANGSTFIRTSSTDRMTIDSSGNVGIGTSSPRVKLDVLSGAAIISDGTAGTASTGGTLWLNTGTSATSRAAGIQAITTSNDNGHSLLFYSNAGGTAPAERARITSGGNLDLQKNLGLGGTSATTSGTGITFPATQSASSDANTLDDYEQGTWTPSVGGNATYTTQSGRYTKIGRMVYVQGAIQINAIGTGSTTAISGLPFATANQTDVESGIAISYFADSSTNIVSLYAFANSSTISLRSLTAAGATLATNAIFKNATAVEFGGWYQAAD